MIAEERAARAIRLRDVEDLINDAFAETDADLVAAWRTCFDDAERTNLWAAQRALSLLRSTLLTWSKADVTALRRGK